MPASVAIPAGFARVSRAQRRVRPTRRPLVGRHVRWRTAVRVRYAATLHSQDGGGQLEIIDFTIFDFRLVGDC